MFRKETEFQETEIGEFPKDWKVVKLKDILILLRNGLTLRQRKDGKGYPVTRIETISEEKIDPTKLGYVTGLSEKDIEEYRLIEGDILFSHVNSLDHIGKTAIYEGEPELLLHGMNLLLLRPNKNIVHPRFLLYLLRLFRARKIFSRMAKKAVNQASINQTELGNLKIPLPPLEEQKRIADILSMIDSGIGTVDRAIAKLEGMKSALLNDLLTGRIRVREENGKLTFYKETEFQDTEIGRIPKDWYVKRLKEVADFQRGFSYKSDEKFAEEIPDGYLFLTLNSVKEGGGLKEDGWTWIKSDRLGERHFIREGDLVIANTDIGMQRGHILGAPAIVHFPEWYKKGKAVFSMDLSKLLLRMSNVDVNFLFYYLSFVQPLARKYHTGTNVWHLNLDSWARDLLIPLPLLEEQKRIADVLLTVDKAIELYREEKERLLRLRRGLMSVLLTGRVRVIGDVKNVGVVT
jgi:type I restriction enzyme S subunit